MSTLEHIQSEIDALSLEDFWALFAWLSEKKQVVKIEPQTNSLVYSDWMTEQLKIAHERSEWITSNRTPRDEKWFESLRQGSWDIMPEDIEDEPWQERDWDALFA